MQDERRHADRGQDVADIDVKVHALVLDGRSWTDTEAEDAREKRLSLGVGDIRVCKREEF
jgi:hypothetical protein